MKEFLKHFIGRQDAYIVRENGKWRREGGSPIEVFDQHLDDTDFAIGSYPIYWLRNKPRCRFICIDLDAHDEGESKEEIKQNIEILYSRSEEYFKCDKKYLIVEESDRGFHIWIILEDDTWLSDAWLYANYIKPKIEELCGQQEFFPKQSHVGITQESYGNGVKLPFYDGNEKRLIHSTYPKEPYKFNIKPFRRDMNKFLSNMNKRNELEKTKSEKRMLDRHEWKRKEFPAKLKHLLERPWFYDIRECIEAVIDGRFQCCDAFGHKMRVAVANELLSKGLSAEEVIEAFRNQDDFNEAITRKYIEYSKRKQDERGHPLTFTCETIKRMGFCLDNCPRRGRRASSPSHNKNLPPELGTEFIKKVLGKETIGPWADGNNDIFKVFEAIYEKQTGKYFLIKTTRSGTTTACLSVGFRRRKRILMIAPTKEIYKSTVKKEAVDLYYDKFFGGGIRTYRIKSNIETCKKIREKFTKEELKEINEVFPFILKPNCKKCLYNENCEYLKFLDKIYNYDLIYITTQKFKALTQSPDGSSILNKLIDWCDVVFIDEFSHIFSVNYKAQILIDTKTNINRLRFCEEGIKIYTQEDLRLPVEIKEMLLRFMRTIYQEIEKFPINIPYYKPIENTEFEKYLRENPRAWAKLYSTIFRHFCQTKDKSLAYLVMIFLALTSKKVYLQQRFDVIGKGKSNKLEGYRQIIFAYVDDMNCILDWIRKIKKKLIITTDAVMPIVPLTEVFDEIEFVRIEDPNNTDNTQTVVVFDCREPFYKLTKQVERDIIKFLKEKECQQESFVIVKNKKVHNFYKQLKHEYKKEDWFRGTSTVGVKSDLRNMIVMGSPYPPRHSYDFVAAIYRDAGYFKTGEYGKKSIEKLGEYFENYDAKTHFFQTISRVKDPEGKEPSTVFVYGMRKEEVENCLDLSLKKISVKTIEEYRKDS